MACVFANCDDANDIFALAYAFASVATSSFNIFNRIFDTCFGVCNISHAHQRKFCNACLSEMTTGLVSVRIGVLCGSALNSATNLSISNQPRRAKFALNISYAFSYFASATSIIDTIFLVGS